MKPRKIKLAGDGKEQVDLNYDGEFLTIELTSIHGDRRDGEGSSTSVVLSKQEDIRAIRGLLAWPKTKPLAEDASPMDRIRRIEDVLGGELFDRSDTIAERLDNHRRAINGHYRTPVEDDPVEDTVSERPERLGPPEPKGVVDSVPSARDILAEDAECGAGAYAGFLARADAEAARQVYVYEARLAARGLTLEDAVEMAMHGDVEDDELQLLVEEIAAYVDKNATFGDRGVSGRAIRHKFARGLEEPITPAELRAAGRRFRAESAIRGPHSDFERRRDAARKAGFA